MWNPYLEEPLSDKKRFTLTTDQSLVVVSNLYGSDWSIPAPERLSIRCGGCRGLKLCLCTLFTQLAPGAYVQWVGSFSSATKGTNLIG